MHIGMVTDSLANLSFVEMVKTAAEIGIEALEFPTGGWSQAPHLDIERMLSDAPYRDQFMGTLREHGLSISALNINGNQLHPVSGSRLHQRVLATVDLASLLGVPTVVLMSGLPGGAPGDTTPNWVTTSWPPETQEILDYQWNSVAIPYWRGLAAYGTERSVRFAVEMHGTQLVYNASTLLRLRDAVGENVGANLDPSHPMWMGADPRELVRALGGAIFNVHMKDTRRQESIAAVNGMLDTQPPQDAAKRAWNYVNLGAGYPGGQQFWAQFVADLRAVGYDGALSLENEDVQFDAVEGVKYSVELLRYVTPHAPASWAPQEI